MLTTAVIVRPRQARASSRARCSRLDLGDQDAHAAGYFGGYVVERGSPAARDLVLGAGAHSLSHVGAFALEVIHLLQQRRTALARSLTSFDGCGLHAAEAELGQPRSPLTPRCPKPRGHWRGRLLARGRCVVLRSGAGVWSVAPTSLPRAQLGRDVPHVRQGGHAPGYPPFATWLRSRYFRPIRTFRDPGHHRFPVMAMPQFAQPDHHNLLICVHYSACCQVSSSHAANPVSPPRTCPSESAFVEAGLCVPVRYRRANK